MAGSVTLVLSVAVFVGREALVLATAAPAETSAALVGKGVVVIARAALVLSAVPVPVPLEAEELVVTEVAAVVEAVEGCEELIGKVLIIVVVETIGPP